jgi:hypothetical protein
MAIAKKIITTYAEMAQFIEDSGFFDTVELDETGNGSVTCKDADGNTVFAIIGVGTNAAKWYGYADASNSVYEQIYGVGCTAYSTANGLMFMHPGQYDGAPCIVSKTNNGAYCVLIPTDSKVAWNVNLFKATNQKAIAWGDVAPFTNMVNSGVVVTGQSNNIPIMETANQTVFSPIATHNPYGTPSFFADAYFLPISQYRSECVFSVDGVKYVTDGFACLKDI